MRTPAGLRASRQCPSVRVIAGGAASPWATTRSYAEPLMIGTYTRDERGRLRVTPSTLPYRPPTPPPPPAPAIAQQQTHQQLPDGVGAHLLGKAAGSEPKFYGYNLELAVKKQKKLLKKIKLNILKISVLKWNIKNIF